MVNSVKSLLWAARLFGGTPFKITRHNVSISTVGIIHAAIASMTLLFIGLTQVYLDDIGTIDKKTLVLAVLRTIFTYICIVADVVFTIIKYEDLKSAIDHIHVYDVAAKFNNKYNNLTLIHCRIVGLIALCFWLPVTYLAYKVENNYPLLETITYILFYGTITSQTLLFYGFMMTLYRRFNHLKWMMEMKIQTLSGTWDGLKLQNVWLMHSNLSTAAEKINNCYSVQLLLWIFSSSMSVLTRLYTMMNFKENFEYITPRDTFCALGVFFNLILIIFSCHITSRRANRIADKVFSPNSTIHRQPNTIEGNKTASIYFCIRKIRFSAASGFIHIHLPLLLSIVGAMTTYLVILSKSSSKDA
ncbi:uncharacterized protein LOC122849374 [Aphidius gifuensis]|uniref:uncharacterized protein LOC122849374 n=1 Tax=Aphidius gifuensis TaxID=684658 RepID=UPI001CDCE461|nr:uncharacterized protein LOC122849374 [Aphidius gifuensis]